MDTIKKYGKPPYSVVAVHGGPGACGEMEPVARELGRAFGVLESIQTATTLAGQVAELRAGLQQAGDTPVTLLGHSWGAWLCFAVAAAFPELVGKLILISSGPFEEIFAAGIMERRLRRLAQPERAEAQSLIGILGGTRHADREACERLALLIEKADMFDPLERDSQATTIDPEIFQGVWPEASRLRASGRLLALGAQITCPVIAIHGAEDAHPAEGVRAPLSDVLGNFQFILLERCGHKPWLERHARARFFEILTELSI